MPRPQITRERPYTFSRGPFAGETFTSERQYRNALARLKGAASEHARQREPRLVTDAAGVARLRPAARQARERSLDALSLMRREELSLGEAARRAGTTPNTVVRYAGPALERRGGRVRAAPSDRLYRQMRMLSTEGVVLVEVRSSRQASLIAEHSNAVKHYFETGDPSRLARFRGKTVAGHEFEVGRGALIELHRRGELFDFESIYQLTY